MPLVPARRQRTARTIDHAANLAWQIEKGLYPVSVLREWAFHPTRKWRFDLVLVVGLKPMPIAPYDLAIEIEGGIFLPTSGRHNRGAGMRSDLEKYAEATILGWRILRVLPEWVQSGKALGLIERAVKGFR